MEKRDGGGKRYKYAVNYKNQSKRTFNAKKMVQSFLIWN